MLKQHLESKTAQKDVETGEKKPMLYGNFKLQAKQQQRFKRAKYKKQEPENKVKQRTNTDRCTQMQRESDI